MKWKTTWSYLPIHYDTTIGIVENITQRTIFWNNLDGEKVKLRFSNKYGKEKLCLERVVIGQKKKDKDIITAMTPVTCDGKVKIEIEPGTEFYSDEITWHIDAGTDIVISVFIKEKSKIQSACSTWSARSWHTVYGVDGDYTDEQKFEEKQSREIYPFVEADVNKADIIAGISGISLYTDDEVKTVALFGDSITHMSYYADALMQKVYADHPGRVAILNRGIGGNRILRDATFVPDMPGEGSCFGRAAISRFKEDVYGMETPEYILMLEGVNDMMHPEVFVHPDEEPRPEELIDGVLQIIETAHQKGSKFYIGTVMPFGNDEMPACPKAEKIRVKFNDWIRTQTVADGVFDFSKALEQDGNSSYLKDGLHIGDGLHPNRAGGNVMADLVIKFK